MRRNVFFCSVTVMLFFALMPLAAVTPPGPIHALKDGTEFRCEGKYPGHVQGVDSDGTYLYWCMTDRIVKTDLTGKPVKRLQLASHCGDPCWAEGKLYIPYCGSGFNKYLNGKPSINYVLVYNSDLEFEEEIFLPELEFGFGAIAYHDGNFYLTGGRPEGMPGVEVMIYDRKFNFRKKVHIPVDTQKGVQVIKCDGKRWLLGCYGKNRTIITDLDFKVLHISGFTTCFGVVPLDGDRVLSILYLKPKTEKLCQAQAKVIRLESPAAKAGK